MVSTQLWCANPLRRRSMPVKGLLGMCLLAVSSDRGVPCTRSARAAFKSHETMDAAIRALHQRSSLAGFPLDRKGVTARDVHSRVAVAAFLENLNLVRTSALSELKGVRLGVEATHWLSSIKVEPLLLATGGSPESLRGHLSDLIAKLGYVSPCCAPRWRFVHLRLVQCRNRCVAALCLRWPALDARERPAQPDGARGSGMVARGPWPRERRCLPGKRNGVPVALAAPC